MAFAEKKITTDVLVVGGGAAGCFAAIKALEVGAKALIVNKGRWLGGSTMIARAGFSAALGVEDPRDNSDAHFHDSVRGGGYLGNQKVLKSMCRDNVEATLDLINWGAVFARGPDGRIDLGGKSRPGHSYPRFVSVAGGFSHIGKAIMDVLQVEIRKREIPVMGNVMITKILANGGKVAGAIGLNWRDGTLVEFNAKTVVVASGGTGHLYKYTDNPRYNTGDGYALMARAGEELVDMEFGDFQLGSYAPPQMFGYPPNCGLWLTRGAFLLNSLGERFYKRYLPHRASEGDCLRMELAVAAANEILDGRGSPNGMVYLNCAGVDREWMMKSRGDFVAHFKRAGVDITWQPMEVAPGNHTYLGGLRIDENAAAGTLSGLYAGGEAAGGWGGANRLGGNGLASALGLGITAGRSAAEACLRLPMPKIAAGEAQAERKRLSGILENKKGVRPGAVRKQVQELMQKNVWLRRDKQGLQATLKELGSIREDLVPQLYAPGGRTGQKLLSLREALEAINIVECGQIVTTAALLREESRGSHQRSDFPETDNRNWLKNTVVWQEGGRVKGRIEPVVATEVPLPEK